MHDSLDQPASRRATPWDFVETPSPVQAFIRDHYRRVYDDRHQKLSETAESNLINSYKPTKCPYCNSFTFVKNGMNQNGVTRYKCKSCNRKFTSTTGTIFQDHKISIQEWIEFSLNIFRYLSINADSLNNKNAFTTSRYWLEKLFLVLSSYQDNIKLSGRIWLDETFYTVRSEDIIKTDKGKELRGTSKNQLCIGVACTEKEILCFCEGNGRPTQNRTLEIFHNHIEPKSTLVHDKDVAHKKLIKYLELIDEAYDSKIIKELPDRENPLYRVNKVHNLLKKFLYAHNSFKRDGLQDYLNFFAFIMNPPSNHLEKVEIILNLTFQVSKTLKYRDFYLKKSDS